MAADLHIHVLEGVTEDDLAKFHSNTLGSKWFSPAGFSSDGYGEGSVFDRVGNTPNVWVGEVSWLKAMLFEDADTYVPSAVEKISELIGEELPVLTPELRDQILAALKLENQTGYSIANPDEVGERGGDDVVMRKFLDRHMGKRLFTISW